jgi:choline monooxygenase
MTEKIFVDPDITKAETLPASFYRSQEIFDQIKEKVFARSWQFIGDTSLVPFADYVHPFWYMEGFLDEPLMLVRQKDESILCLSNVCTHRGNLVVQQAGKQRSLTCMYHGRQFEMNGDFKFMPEFKGARDFPRPCEGLHNCPTKVWNNFIFSALEPAFDITKVFEIMDQRVGFLPMHEFQLERSLSRDYLVNSNWALYCDNYLEGFHIPFVHPDLNAALDYSTYTTELDDYMSLQVGYADDGVECFDLPAGHPDDGKKVAAYYYWIFPNLMFNFYPWGLSINVVKPLTANKTKVSFISYVYDHEKLEVGAGAKLDKVEREDEYVVEGVQKGISSRFYKNGRFAPEKEKGVHHFQRMLAEALK